MDAGKYAESEDETRSKCETQLLDVESSFKTLIADMEREQARERDQYQGQIKKVEGDELTKQKRWVGNVRGVCAGAGREVGLRGAGAVMRSRMEQAMTNLKNEVETDKRYQPEALQRDATAPLLTIRPRWISRSRSVKRRRAVHGRR